MTAVINPYNFNFSTNKDESNIDIEHEKYKNLPRKYVGTITLTPQILEKENMLLYEIPFGYHETKNITYLHNIQAINNKDYLDWTLIYHRNYTDFIPNSLFTVMQKFHNISNKNIIPFDVTTNNYLPLLDDWKYFIGNFQLTAKINNKDLKISSMDLQDLTVTVDLFTLEEDKTLQTEYTKKLEQDIENIRHDANLSKRVDRKYYKYKSKTILGFYHFNYWNVREIKTLTYKKINKINEIVLDYYSRLHNQSYIIIDANNIKLSNILLYLNNKPISNLEIENINDRFYFINTQKLELDNVINIVITFKADRDENEDIKKIKFYSIFRNTI